MKPLDDKKPTCYNFAKLKVHIMNDIIIRYHEKYGYDEGWLLPDYIDDIDKPWRYSLMSQMGFIERRAYGANRKALRLNGKPLKENQILTEWHIRHILEKQFWECNNPYCKCDLKENNWEVDHIIPFCRNGINNIKNIQALCEKCHCLKSTYSWKEFLNKYLYQKRITLFDHQPKIDLFGFSKKIDLFA
jgi:5-methylcytosine-specific restriction endonuclease McrA